MNLLQFSDTDPFGGGRQFRVAKKPDTTPYKSSIAADAFVYVHNTRGIAWTLLVDIKHMFSKLFYVHYNRI